MSENNTSAANWQMDDEKLAELQEQALTLSTSGYLETESEQAYFHHAAQLKVSAVAANVLLESIVVDNNIKR